MNAIDMPKRSSTIGEYERMLSAVKQFIGDGLSDDKLDLNGFCFQCNYSRRSVQRALAWNGTTWRLLLIAMRMEKAKSILDNKNNVMSIKEIANIVGYRQASQFSKTFKTIFGNTPAKYRALSVGKE